jgi:hypothetical protein
MSPPSSLSVVQDRGSLTQSQAGYLWRGAFEGTRDASIEARAP